MAQRYLIRGDNMPTYYSKKDRKECIIEMREIYGDYAVLCFCLLNAYKYNYRAGLKSGNTAESDFNKARWYLDYASGIRKASAPKPTFFTKLKICISIMRGVIR